MTKLLNNPADVVREMLEGIARRTPHLALLGDEDVFVRRQNGDTVAVISRGGSGWHRAVIKVRI